MSSSIGSMRGSSSTQTPLCRQGSNEHGRPVVVVLVTVVTVAVVNVPVVVDALVVVIDVEVVAVVALVVVVNEVVLVLVVDTIESHNPPSYPSRHLQTNRSLSSSSKVASRPE